MVSASVFGSSFCTNAEGATHTVDVPGSPLSIAAPTALDVTGWATDVAREDCLMARRGICRHSSAAEVTSVGIEALSGNESAFDLNVGKVLEHWTVAFAIRELIANALDEQVLTGTAGPEIAKDSSGRWYIRDYGRGLRYEHLAQNESTEKRRHGGVIGQFGMGLKDALAVFDRHQVSVEIFSPHGDVTTSRRGKEQFADVVTLHAMVTPPSDPQHVGTLVVLTGATDEDVAQAKRFFLRYGTDEVLETTRFGQVLGSTGDRAGGRVYVRGLLVAEEANFLFSYNITELSAPLRRALNRERTNVGRTAYAERIKAMLKLCCGAVVAEALTRDLAEFSSGRQHDELRWRDVAVHACRVLATHEKVLFVTARQLGDGAPHIHYAKADGYRAVVVPDDIATKLRRVTDLNGEAIVDLRSYRERWNDSFTFTFVDPDQLNIAERQCFELTTQAIAAAGVDPGDVGVNEVLISETMRLSERGDDIVGVFEPNLNRIVIRRDQLTSPEIYLGTLLHEVAHATSGATDASFEFETALTETLGLIAGKLLTASVSPTRSP